MAASSSGFTGSTTELRLRLRATDERLLLRRVPPAHLDRRHLLGRGDPRAELLQVAPQHELERVLRVRVADRRSVGGVGRAAEVEAAVADGDLVPDLSRARPQELPVGEIRLRHVRMGRRRRVDTARLDSGAPRHLLREVGIADVAVGLGPAAAVEPVRLVVAPHERTAPDPVELGFERGDLAGDERVARIVPEPGGGDLHLRADRQAGALEDLALRVAEREDEHVREEEVVVDDGELEASLELLRQRASVDRDLRSGDVVG